MAEKGKKEPKGAPASKGGAKPQKAAPAAAPGAAAGFAAAGFAAAGFAAAGLGAALSAAFAAGFAPFSSLALAMTTSLPRSRRAG